MTMMIVLRDAFILAVIQYECITRMNAPCDTFKMTMIVSLNVFILVIHYECSTCIFVVVMNASLLTTNVFCDAFTFNCGAFIVTMNTLYNTIIVTMIISPNVFIPLIQFKCIT